MDTYDRTTPERPEKTSLDEDHEGKGSKMDVSTRDPCPGCVLVRRVKEDVELTKDLLTITSLTSSTFLFTLFSLLSLRSTLNSSSFLSSPLELFLSLPLSLFLLVYTDSPTMYCGREYTTVWSTLSTGSKTTIILS